MRSNPLFAPLAAAAALLMLGQAARAELLVQVDKSTQRMTVSLDGKQLYVWPVSTGGPGYDTPSGTFKPFRKEIDHHSEEWDNAPMPYSIFFTKTGDAVHGTYEQRSLGRAVSHGCVRLSVKNAATLWKLVEREKMANTSVVLSGTIPAGGGEPVVARARPMPLGADDPRYGTPPQYRQGYYAQPRYSGQQGYYAQQRYRGRQGYYGQPGYGDQPDDDDQPVYGNQPVYDDQPRYGAPPPFPFSLFGR
jgi:hypothetical protein